MLLRFLICYIFLSTCLALQIHAQQERKLSYSLMFGAGSISGQPKTNDAGLPSNIFAGFHKPVLFGLGVNYKLNEHLYLGGLASYFSADKEAYILTNTSFAFTIKNYLYSGKKLKPFIFFGAGPSFTGLKRFANTVIFYPPQSFSTSASAVNVTQINYNFPDLKLIAVPSASVLLGGGFDYSISKKISVFLQYSYNLNLIKYSKLVKENYSNNTANLKYSLISAGLTLRLFKKKDDRKDLIAKKQGLYAVAWIDRDSLKKNDTFLLIGRITYYDLKKSKDLIISILDTNGRLVEKTITKNNYFIFKKLPPNDYVIASEEDPENIKAELYFSQDDSKIIKEEVEKSSSVFSKDSIIIFGKASYESKERPAAKRNVYLINYTNSLVQVTTTDKDGYFAFKKLATDNFKVVSDDPKIKTEISYSLTDNQKEISLSEIYKILPSDTSLISLIVQGKIDTTSTGGKPVIVLILNDKGEVIGKAITSDDGYFVFTKLKPDNYKIVFENDNAGLKAKISYSNADPALKISQADIASKDSLNKDIVIRGKIRSSDPAAALENRGVVLINDKSEVIGRTFTSREGYFLFTRLETGNYQVVIEDSDPRIKAEITSSVADPGMSLNIGEKISKEDSLRNSDRFAIAGKINSSDTTKSVNQIGLLLINDKGEVIQKTRTSKEGNFAFRKLQSDNYQIVFENADPSMKATVNAGIEDPQLKIAGADLSKFNVTSGREEKLTAKDEITVTGIVNYPNDKKSKDKIIILLLDKDGNVIGRVETNKDGFFAFKHLHPDNYQIMVEDMDPALTVKFQVFDDISSQSGFKTDSLLATILFDLNQSSFSDGEKVELEKFITHFKDHSEIKKVNLNAYGDASGTMAYNIILTQKRGETVLAYLKSRGLSGEKFKINAFGKSLAVKNSTSDPKLNRKVDIVILE